MRSTITRDVVRLAIRLRTDCVRWNEVTDLLRYSEQALKSAARRFGLRFPYRARRGR